MAELKPFSYNKNIAVNFFAANPKVDTIIITGDENVFLVANKTFALRHAEEFSVPVCLVSRASVELEKNETDKVEEVPSTSVTQESEEYTLVNGAEEGTEGEESPAEVTATETDQSEASKKIAEIFHAGWEELKFGEIVELCNQADIKVTTTAFQGRKKLVEEVKSKISVQ